MSWNRSLFLLICLVTLTEVSSHNWFSFVNSEKSSACVGATTLACTKHNLKCPSNQQIKISRAFYGFVQTKNTCPTSRTTCSEQRDCHCKWYRGDCGILYSNIDNVEVMRCSGQRSCSPTSATSIDSSKCNKRKLWSRKYNPKNSYTEIDYDCIKAQRIDPDEPNVIKGSQIVLNASKDYAYTYTVSSTKRRPVFFYQTNRQLKIFNLHGHQTRAGIEYKLKGKFEFTILPKTDTLIILTVGSYPSDIQVRFKRHASGEIPESTKPTTPTSTTIRSRPGTKTTTEAFDMNTKTTTEAFDMEEVTRNIDDEIIEEENNDSMKSHWSQTESEMLIGPLIGAIIGIVVLMIILVIVVLLICKRRRRKKMEPVVVDKGVSNPGYEVSYVKPEYMEPPPSYEEIDPRNHNSGVLPGGTPDDYNHLNDVMTNQRNDVKDTGLNVNESEKQNFDDTYKHLQ